jgi:hypothetical protein
VSRNPDPHPFISIGNSGRGLLTGEKASPTGIFDLLDAIYEVMMTIGICDD